MAKYKRSIRGGTFRPEQVSERGESRLQEYSNRITSALRDERDAVISNRNRTADAMRENAQIESQQASTNAQIQQQNVQTKLNDIQTQNAAAQRQFDIDTRAQKQIFSAISDFSLTAGKKLQEIEVERVHEKWNQDYYQTLLLGDNDPNVKALEGIIKDAQIKQVEGHTKLNGAQQSGADELEVSKVRQQISDLSYGSKLAVMQKLAKKYPSFANQLFMDDTRKYTDSQGNTFTGVEASQNRERTSIVLGLGSQAFLDINQLTGINPALLHKSGLLNSIFSYNESSSKKAGNIELANIKYAEQSALNDKLANAPDPATARSIIETEWPAIVGREGGFENAHNYLTQLVQTVDEDGKPVYSEAALFSAKIGSKGGTFEEDHPKRAIEIRSALSRANSAAFRQQEQRNQIAAIQDFRLRQDAFNSQLFEAGARDKLDIIATAKKAYADRYNGFIPPQLVDLERRVLKENKEEAAQKLQVVQQLARDGVLTQGKVLSIEDPTMRAEAQALLIEQNKTRRFGNDYQETLKALKQDAKLIAKDSLEGGSSSAAVEVQLFMEKQFASWYKEGLAQNNNDPTAALAYARQNHQAELAKSKAGIEDGLYYRKFDNYNGSVYPNIQADKKRTDAIIDQNISRIENTIGSVGATALDSPGLVSSTPDLRNLSQTHYTGGSISSLITPEIKAAARLLGVSEIEVINRQIDAYNKYNQDKIEPIRSPSLDLVNNARPETQRLFTDMPTIGSVDRGLAEISQEPLRDPNNMRRTFAYTSKSRQEEAFIQTIRAVEGTSGSQGYNTVYGGAVVPQLTQMTLGELYDAIKLGGSDAIPARLGGGKIPFKKDRYNSSASGALQLMPETLRGLVERGNYNWNDTFSPETQNRMILDLARQGGVDIENMSPSQMAKAGNIWAGASPRYGQTTRTADDSYRIYQRLLQQ